MDESGEISALLQTGAQPLTNRASGWRGSVADDAAEKHDPPGSALFHIAEHGLKGGKIGTNVRDLLRNSRRLIGNQGRSERNW